MPITICKYSRIFQLEIISWLIVVFTLIIFNEVQAQLSPGDLTEYHSHLEGLSNCTKCHILGNKISNEKCLSCHKEIQSRITKKLGYHASNEVIGKNCNSCHSDHHGKTFKIIKFNTELFKHQLTGFNLEGAHAKHECNKCHDKKYIKEASLKNKKFTYLGLDSKCNSCHIDYHQNTLSANCRSCHDFESFKPATLFQHEKTKFPLKGKHQSAGCVKCHKYELKNGKTFQEFGITKYGSCSDCHEDIHKGKFGKNCTQCHTETGFNEIKGSSGFNHSKTNFPLTGKHQGLVCKSCHKNNITDPLKHQYCFDCHKDTHKGQFTENGHQQDCSECHQTSGFSPSTYSIEKHNSGKFRLEGSHLATPCFSCHKKNDQWVFRKMANRCNDCHENIHEKGTPKAEFRYSECTSCHNVQKWNSVNYNHEQTKFPLTQAHSRQSCRQCHFSKSPDGSEISRFAGLPSACTQCHTDNHYGQFQVNGETNCLNCHQAEAWKIESFNHDQTNFKLDGKHKNIPCIRCHKPVNNNSIRYILYKNNKTKCEDCH